MEYVKVCDIKIPLYCILGRFCQCEEGKQDNSDQCKAEDCENGGKCFCGECDCKPGFTGKCCQIDEDEAEEEHCSVTYEDGQTKICSGR